MKKPNVVFGFLASFCFLILTVTLVSPFWLSYLCAFCYSLDYAQDR